MVKIIFNEQDGKFEMLSEAPIKKERKEKGKSIIAFPSEFIVLDIETTGLSPAYDEIIEVAALKIKGDVIVDSYSSLVNPNCEIPYEVEELTGITQEMVDNAPTFSNIANDFFAFIGNYEILGHNVSFDINFLYDNFEKAGLLLKNNFIDTMRISRKLHSEQQHHRLKDLIKFYNIQMDKLHRALADCKATFEVYQNLKHEICNTYTDCKAFADLFNKNAKNFDLTKLKSTVTDFDETHPLFGKVCVFTGTLDKMIRKDAAQLVVNYGGFAGNSVTTKTNFLILGNYDYCKSIKGGKSSKHKKAESLKQQGYDIEIIPEDVFYDMIFESKKTEMNEIDVFNRIKENIDRQYRNIIDFELESTRNKTENAYFVTAKSPSTPWRAETSKKSITKIKFCGSENYITFALSCEGRLKEYSIKYTESKSENILRVSIEDFSKTPLDVIGKLFTDIVLNSFSFETFGCCGKFKECEDKGYCVHQDLLYATACQYRRIIESKNK